MDELLEVVDVLADSGLEEAFAWLLRIIGIVCILAGIGVWLFVDVTILIPIGLVVVGIALLVVPEILLGLLELV